MSYSMPMWVWLEKLAKAREEPEPSSRRQDRYEDYLTDKREWPPEPTGLDRLRGGVRRRTTWDRS